MTDKYITAFAPASIGNVGVGFDMLGLAIENVGDRVSARKTEEKGVRIKEIYDLNGEAHSSLSKNTNENTASISASSLWESQSQSYGLELVIHKGIPLQSGMGSSAASAVAGAVVLSDFNHQVVPAVPFDRRLKHKRRPAARNKRARRVRPWPMDSLGLQHRCQ